MNLNQPYYIEPRNGDKHIDLDGKWDFFSSVEQIENFFESQWEYSADLPSSVYHCLNQAGVLPDPYIGTNSRLYHDVDEKIWYFKKKFIVSKCLSKKIAFLCFDGIAYYCRVWINGVLLGEHEGMFGGPVCDISQYLRYDMENELIVEIKACTYGIKEDFDSWNRKGENIQIVPWNIARDTETSNGDFIVLGIWNRIRIEFVEKIHISRPYLYTKDIFDGSAELFLEFEIVNGRVKELQPYQGYDAGLYTYTRAYDRGLTGKTLDEEVEIHVRISENGSGNTVYYEKFCEKLIDYDRLGIAPEYYEQQFVSKKIRIDNPKLWYPIGLGEPFLYNVELELYHKDSLCDSHNFNFGIRTFTAERTAGRKYRMRWNDFLFSVNGKKFFLKGFNWMPVDYLYKIEPAEYEWCLTLAKNAGIQMLRVWSGGGMPETDTFYEICDRLGIMVWQDHMLANMLNTQKYPQDILESQEAYNIYRIRNHPSLVMHCGGNEFNPYSPGIASSLFIIERIIKDLDPSRIFHYTTADKGSAHIYEDMEPVWYRHAYKELPFLGESGIHSFPNFKSLTQLLRPEECTCVMPDMSSEEFQQKFPELLNHFVEYLPSRVPRMMSRASQIGDLSKYTLEDMCEATHVQAYEFYTIMIQAMHENYPYCGGILPWVFKRHWTTAGIQVVDGLGQPIYPYYAVLNAYKPINVCLCLEWSVIAPKENIPLRVKIFNDSFDNLNSCKITVTVYDPNLIQEMCYSEIIENNRTEFYFDSFTPNEKYTDKCFLINVCLTKGAETISQSTYFIKCNSALSDPDVYKKHRTSLCENLYFHKGPWLKDNICDAMHSSVAAQNIGMERIGAYDCYNIQIMNISDVVAYPVTIEVTNQGARFFASDNFFLLKERETKNISVFCDKISDLAEIKINGWNFETITLK